ncbi:MAG: hypothetical protein ABI876_10555 [Bacteroidota bacterium]
MSTDWQNLIDISGRMLRAIRIRAGWNRPRFSDALMRHRAFEGDFTSVKSIERYEALPLVSPILVERYRTIIGPDLFDTLLERYRKDAREAAERRLGTS